ncbi:uncharacterized protein OCT59_007536 [Rhizophagus irregularis]|uniref:uncharacterized protein n=1 Tax=Rhizophagus irregularis TaxID=588596 RepID=UPI00331A8B38|nr:hypothetical protein OCT59_007536 [Rhizophagus irregularis]
MTSTTETNKFIEQELSNVLKEYEYGVTPNSIEILPTRSLNSDAHQSSIFKLTLLENVKLIITIAEEGYIALILIKKTWNVQKNGLINLLKLWKLYY